MLTVGRPSTEFNQKTKSGIKASQAFETTGSHQVVSTYEEQEDTNQHHHENGNAVDFHPNEYSAHGRGGMDSDEDMEAKQIAPHAASRPSLMNLSSEQSKK